MKKSELRKLIRETIREQEGDGQFSPGGSLGMNPLPMIQMSGNNTEVKIACPPGYMFEGSEGLQSQNLVSAMTQECTYQSGMTPWGNFSDAYQDPSMTPQTGTPLYDGGYGSFYGGWYTLPRCVVDPTELQFADTAEVNTPFCCDVNAYNFGSTGTTLVPNADTYVMQQGPNAPMCNDDLCIYQRYNCSNSGVCTATNDPSAPFSSLEECEASGCGQPSPMAPQPRKQRRR